MSICAEIRMRSGEMDEKSRSSAEAESVTERVIVCAQAGAREGYVFVCSDVFKRSLSTGLLYVRQ